MNSNELLLQLGRQTIRVGSSESCEIVLRGAQVPPIAAEIIHEGNGRLSFVSHAAAQCTAGDKPLASGLPVPFELSIRYAIGGITIPNAHRAICLMVMARGHLFPRDEQLILGRDPERCHIVMNSPGVSGCHAIIKCGPQIAVSDQNSTSGTWYLGARLPPQSFQVLPDEAVIALGPVPLPVALIKDLHRALTETEHFQGGTRTEAMPLRTTERRALPSQLPTLPREKHRTVMGTVKMSQAAGFNVGRTADNAIVLDYAQVSARHAQLIQVDQSLYVQDLDSELGTFVRGTKLKSGQRAQLSDGERIFFGPIAAIVQMAADSTVQLVVEDHKGWAGRPLFDIAAAGVTVEVQDRDDSKRKKLLLRDVHFKAQPGDLVALMGPSGSGKTTLLHALTGYIRPSSGEVLVNGSPLPQIFESLRGSIGYVPQDDIIHSELTVYEAVRYSAGFRLPHDYSREEIDRRVRLTLSQLGLESVSHLQIGRPEHKVLSGGQRKRVNIAIELVTDPVLLFLDEPTSGLAADDTTSLVELLATLAREHGKTIIATIHQPARDEYEKFNLALILGHGGIPIYFGPTTSAYDFFESWRGLLHTQGISNPRDMFAELKEREARFEKEMPGRTRTEVQEAVALAFNREYLNSRIFQDLKLVGRGIDRVSAEINSIPRRSHSRGQLRLLISRYLKVKRRDKVGTTILLLQAPLIGVMLSLVFGGQKESVPYFCLGALNELAKRNGQVMDASRDVLASLENAPDHAGALFFLVVAAVWFGTSNAAREIVNERAIFRRERMVNLGIGRYVLSKFLVLSALSIVQCAILLGIVFTALGLSGGFLSALGMVALTSICSVALGLLLSAAVASSEAAMALTPIALIPQVVLGGLMVPVTTNPWLRWPMQFIPARWGFEGVVRPERLAVSELKEWRIHLPGAADSMSDFVQNEYFLCALAQMESSHLTGAWGFSSASAIPAVTLGAMTASLLGLVAFALHRQP